jgi:Polyketide cyclase / dehydrase and lipid transport
MSTYRHAAHFDAPVERVWDLVGNPEHHPEWWPRVIEVRGKRFEEGDLYAQVTRGPMGTGETNFLIERREDLREIRMRCQDTGMYACWLLTEAQGGTFVQLEMGMDPADLAGRVFDVTAGRLYFRRWSSQSLEGLRKAAADSGTRGDK